MNNSEVSVVVVGAINEYTQECLSSIRKNLPGSYIILSTCGKVDVDSLDFDKVVFSEDPGIRFETTNTMHNYLENFSLDVLIGTAKPYNYKTYLKKEIWGYDKIKGTNTLRKLVSMHAGVMKVQTQYTLIVRSDFALINDSFKDYFKKFDNFNDDYKRVKNNKILSSGLFGIGELWIPGDQFYFGETEDLIKLTTYKELPLGVEEGGVYIDKHLQVKDTSPVVFGKLFLTNTFDNKVPQDINNLLEYPTLTSAILSDLKYNKDNTQKLFFNNFITMEPSLFGLKILNKELSKLLLINLTHRYNIFMSPLSLYIHYYNKEFQQDILSSNHHERIHNTWMDYKQQFYNGLTNLHDVVEDCDNFANMMIKEKLAINKGKTILKEDFSNMYNLDEYLLTDTSIDFKDITVVIRGLINQNIIHKVIESIKYYLPTAYIILSTWDNQDCEGIKVDRIILSKSNNNFTASIDYQLHLANQGLNEIKSLYTLLIRSDIELTGNDFLLYFNNPNYNKVVDNYYRINKKKVITSSIYNRKNNVLTIQTCYNYHLSDFIHFGLSCDVKNLWVGNELKEVVKTSSVPEIMIIMMWLRNSNKRIYYNAIFKDHITINKQGMIDWNKFLISNFMVLDVDQLQFIWHKKDLGIYINPPSDLLSNFLFDNIFSYNDWVNLYNALTDSTLLLKVSQDEYLKKSMLLNIQRNYFLFNRDGYFKMFFNMNKILEKQRQKVFGFQSYFYNFYCIFFILLCSTPIVSRFVSLEKKTVLKKYLNILSDAKDNKNNSIAYYIYIRVKLVFYSFLLLIPLVLPKEKKNNFKKTIDTKIRNILNKIL